MYSGLDPYGGWDRESEHYRTEKRLQKCIIYIQPTFQASPKWNWYDTIISDPRSVSIATPTYAFLTSTDGWSVLDANLRTVIITPESIGVDAIRKRFPRHNVKTTTGTGPEDQIFTACLSNGYQRLYWTYATRGIAQHIDTFASATDIFPK